MEIEHSQPLQHRGSQIHRFRRWRNHRCSLGCIMLKESLSRSLGWLNTTMTENRKILNTSDLDGFDKRKLPSPGFQVEVVLADYNYPPPPPLQPSLPSPDNEMGGGSPAMSTPSSECNVPLPENLTTESRSKDDVFSDSEAEEGGGSAKGIQSPRSVRGMPAEGIKAEALSKDGLKSITRGIEQASLEPEHALEKPRSEEEKILPTFRTPELESTSTSEFKAIAADASVFSFGDEDYDSE